ncbi:MAG: acyltransferase family protein [Egibacteraceae bacterium]
MLIYLALVLIVEQGSLYGQGFVGNLPYFLTYTSNWFVSRSDDRVIFYSAWSLATEEQFYLVWPSVERFTHGLWLVAAACGLILTSLVAGSGPVTEWLGAEHLLRTILQSVSVPICLGVLLAHLLHDRRGYRWAGAWLGHRFASPWLFLMVIVGLATMDGWGRWGLLGVEMLMALLVGSCVVREDHGLALLLKLRPIARIGVISYGMYLLHVLVLNVVRRLLGVAGLDTPLLRFTLCLVLTIGVASLSYRYYESFFLRRKQRFTRPPAPDRAEAEAAGAAVR